MKVKSLVATVFTLGCMTMNVGCGFVFNSIYGIKNPKMLHENEIVRWSEKFTIPMHESYIIDSNYISFIKIQDSILYNVVMSNHLQPLQALYFDDKGKLVSFHINCYTGGFPNLKWNRNSMMEVFPPLQQAPLDSLVSFSLINKNIRPIIADNKVNLVDSNYTVIVFWNRFMGRQTKRFLKTIRSNCSLAKKDSVNVIYINNDSWFSE